MKKIIFALVFLSLLVNAAIDQSYEHTLKRDGSSVLVKSMEVNIFTGELSGNALEKIAETCNTTSTLKCSVDVENTTIIIEESLSPGTYYTFKSEYELFVITHNLAINKIPTDKFSDALEVLLEESGVLNTTGSESADAVDLLDKEANAEGVYYLKKLGANITYSINMPAGIEEAAAGNVTAVVDGDYATFDLLDVMDEAQSMRVKSSELNYGNIILIAGAIVIGALAYSFFGGKKKKKSVDKRRRKRKK